LRTMPPSPQRRKAPTMISMVRHRGDGSRPTTDVQKAETSPQQCILVWKVLSALDVKDAALRQLAKQARAMDVRITHYARDGIFLLPRFTKKRYRRRL
jgi:hypothetical protein